MMSLGACKNKTKLRIKVTAEPLQQGMVGVVLNVMHDSQDTFPRIDAKAVRKM